MEIEKKEKTRRMIIRVIMLIIGNILIGAGIALFKTAAFGSDPHSAMVFMIVGKLEAWAMETFGIQLTFSIVFYILSAIYFIFLLIFSRKRIGLGTIFNVFFVGYFTDFFLMILTKITPDPTMAIRVLYLLLGLIIVSLGVSMYQTCDLGVGPYDALAMILDDRLPLKYFWCRIMTDGCCAVIAVILGGFGTLVGFGSLLSAFGLGPVISFFTKYVSEKLLNIGSKAVPAKET